MLAAKVLHTIDDGISTKKSRTSAARRHRKFTRA
jgi:hypothetical protein